MSLYFVDAIFCFLIGKDISTFLQNFHCTGSLDEKFFSYHVFTSFFAGIRGEISEDLIVRKNFVLFHFLFFFLIFFLNYDNSKIDDEGISCM